MTDVQKAPYSKRLFAFFADLILAGILTTGVYFVMSVLLNVDSYNDTYKQIISGYEQEYGVTFGMTAEEYNTLSEEEKTNYTNAVNAANADERANNAIRTSYSLSFAIFASGIVISVLILEFVIPIFTKDGRSLGKLLFGLGVMRGGCIRISKPVLFVRNVIGKGVFEGALPAVIILTVFNNVTGVFGIILLVVFIIAEIVSLVRSGGSAMLHDVLADTVVIDWASQRIYNSAEEKAAYEEKQKQSAIEHDPYRNITGNDEITGNK